jgi:hypothetical protein
LFLIAVAIAPRISRFFKLWNNDIDIEEYDWVGGSFYLENAGFYKQCTEGGECYSSSLIPSGVTTKFNGVDDVSCKWLWDNHSSLIISPFLTKY